jgi:hypothetical protein
VSLDDPGDPAHVSPQILPPLLLGCQGGGAELLLVRGRRYLSGRELSRVAGARRRGGEAEGRKPGAKRREDRQGTHLLELRLPSKPLKVPVDVISARSSPWAREASECE